MAWSAHDRVGRYRLLSTVGFGRSCEVWEAIDDQNSERRAIKVLKEGYARSPEQVALLKREFAVGRGLDHPHVIRIYEFNKQRGAIFLVMELFPAQNTKQFLLQGGVEGLAHLMPQIADHSAAALGYLHSQGWVHRDVKPDNFLLNRQGNVKLIDFALAERPKGILGRLLPSRMKIQGTRSYMSPEQIRGRGVDERSDIYGLACMWYELISGKPPFTGATTPELLNKHLKTPAPPLEATGRDVTSDFAELVRKMLSKNPAKRPQSMADVLRSLRSLQVFNRIPSAPVAEKSS